MNKIVGYHVNCGGEVAYPWGERKCTKCGADGKFGRPSPELVTVTVKRTQKCFVCEKDIKEAELVVSGHFVYTSTSNMDINYEMDYVLASFHRGCTSTVDECPFDEHAPGCYGAWMPWMGMV